MKAPKHGEAGYAGFMAAALAMGGARLQRQARGLLGTLGRKPKRWSEPHQGKKECARRRRQMASGMLPPGATIEGVTNG